MYCFSEDDLKSAAADSHLVSQQEAFDALKKLPSKHKISDVWCLHNSLLESCLQGNKKYEVMFNFFNIFRR